ncbi:MAG TPA: thiol reductant ABC exporter subunit CydD [Micromonosporaceae bacterium]|nr:thiol reductant ABC exporter subunit CydD [Micromonosporaceae bacterium]
MSIRRHRARATGTRALDRELLRRAPAAYASIALTVLAGTATGLLVIGQAALIARGIATVSTSVCLPLAATVVGRAGCAWLAEVCGYRASGVVKSRLRRDLLGHALDLGPRWLAGERTGELTALVTRGTDGLDAYLGRYLPQLVLAVTVPVAALVALVDADPLSALIVAATLPLIPLFMALVGASTRARARRRWATLGRLSHHFLDLVSGLATLKAFGRAEAQADRIRDTSDGYRRATMGTLRLAFLSSLVLELLSTLSVALVAVDIGFRLVGGHLDLHTALFVLVLAPEVYAPLRALGAQFHASADGLAALAQARAVLDTPAPAAGTDTRTPHGDLEIRGVTVRHEGRGLPAPDRISLTVSPGEFVAVTGASGAGKSTLLAVLLGFVRPDAGSVSMGGREMTTFDTAAWRRAFAWVPQEPWLVAGTVADNIALGRPHATRHDIDAAARVAALDLDLDRVLGEPAGLSAGERRRVAIARAVLRDAPVLLLDEPTAGIDPATEEKLLERLAATGRTIVAVTHRRAAIAAAGRVVSLDPAADAGPARHIEVADVASRA